jgi:hypothetical protein
MSSDYDAELWNVNDPKESYGTASIEAATDDEAKAKAHEWAVAVAERSLRRAVSDYRRHHLRLLQRSDRSDGTVMAVARPWPSH